MLKEYDLTQLTEPLVGWFEKNARTMPWRSNPLPYYVWVSEIMLQQTRVEAVRRYFDRFVAELPDVDALASCPEDTYLKLWEGLGYYSRVRNLHAAAVQIMEEHGGQIPDDYQTLLTLKGIGHYTAGAIASLAYEKPVPAVDGNVLRVLTRVSADDTDIIRQSFRAEVEGRIRELLEQKAPDGLSPRIFNQALMELGALVCVPNGAPHCGECPWEQLCQAKKEDRIGEIPVKTRAKARRTEKKTVLLIKDGDTIALHKRSPAGLLAGLYEFPNKTGYLTEKEVLDLVRNMGYSPLRIQRLTDAVHVFSHVEWHMIGYSLLVEEESFATDEQRARAAKEQLVFTDAAELEKHYALPSAFGAYRRYIIDRS